MKVEASLNNLRITPRKVRLVAYSIKGLSVDEAAAQLEKQVKKPSDFLAKLLESAIANAENNFSLDRSNLFVDDVVVGEGPKLKRWMPRAQGRATPIWRRMSRVRLILAEKVEGKIVKKQKKVSKKEEHAEGKEKKAVSSSVAGKVNAKKVSPTKTRGGYGKKVFQRKSA